MSSEAITEKAILAAYPASSQVRIKAMSMELGQALQMEGAGFCMAPEDRRLDPEARVQYLLGALSAGGTPLLLEHQEYLDRAG